MIPTLPRPYVEHLVRPRNVGDVPRAEAAGEVGSMVGGLGVRVTLAYRDAGGGRPVIARAGARTFGSAATVAPASIVTEMLLGKTPTDAEGITCDDVLDALSDGRPDELPPRVRHATTLVVEAARRALGTPGRAPPSDPAGEGILVCRCIGVGDRRIRAAVEDGARSAEEVAEACGAGTGCRSCRPDVLLLLDQASGAAAVEPDASMPLLLRVAWVLALPLLRALGMTLLDGSLEGEETVRLVVAPARARPDVTEAGAAELVRFLLRETVHDAVRVEVVRHTAPGR
jgi:NifU-like protein